MHEGKDNSRRCPAASLPTLSLPPSRGLVHDSVLAAVPQPRPRKHPPPPSRGLVRRSVSAAFPRPRPRHRPRGLVHGILPRCRPAASLMAASSMPCCLVHGSVPAAVPQPCPQQRPRRRPSKQSLVQTFAEGGEVSLFRGAYVCQCMCELFVCTLSVLHTHTLHTVVGANFF